MKNFIVVFFLCIYSFSALQINEYLKLPILEEHFNEHKFQNPKLSLYSFILNHYAKGQINDDDYLKDMKLPFKTHNCICSCSAIAIYFLPIETFNFENKFFLKEYKKPFFGYNFSFISNFQSSIWQPPKIC